MNQPLLVTATQKAGPRLTLTIGALVVLLLLALPLLSLLPADHALQVSAYTLTLVGKILCYAIVALALDLVWGYAGLLSLGHGLFFALGGYAMGMYLMRQASGDELPAFMTFLSWTELPWYWTGTEHFWWAMCLVVLAPGLLALVFGFFAFRSRIKGVYFSIMTQALTFAGMLLFFRNETGFGGNNGFTNFRSILGFGITEPGTRAVLFFATVLLLVASLYIGWRLAKSKFGRVLTALRDAENRLMFCGYDPRGFKLFVWVLSAVLCGLAGALYVPQVGIINPSEMSPTNSIEAAVWVALGGYAMGMYLMRQASGDDLPAFMTFLSWTELPWYWAGTDHFLWALCLVVLAPGLLALVFGFFAFRSRIKGVYFSIMTQALTFAGMLLFFRNETGFGGNNGFTNFRSILGFGITEPGTRAVLFIATVVLLVASLYIGWRLAKSKFGRVLTALRDAENRLMFCGYDPRGFKLFVWVLSAVLCGLAGALYVPQVGIINPSEMSPTNSIEAAVWVALGGRGTLIGPLLGAGVVNGMKSWFTVAFPEYWLFFLGALFIIVTLYLPKGVIGLLKK